MSTTGLSPGSQACRCDFRVGPLSLAVFAAAGNLDWGMGGGLRTLIARAIRVGAARPGLQPSLLHGPEVVGGPDLPALHGNLQALEAGVLGAGATEGRCGCQGHE